MGLDEYRYVWGRNIARMRAACGWTQADLARRIGVTRQAVSMWESGDRPVGDDTKLAIAAQFRLPVEVMFPLFNTTTVGGAA